MADMRNRLGHAGLWPREALRCFSPSLDYCVPIRSSSGIDKTERAQGKRAVALAAQERAASTRLKGTTM